MLQLVAICYNDQSLSFSHRKVLFELCICQNLLPMFELGS